MGKFSRYQIELKDLELGRHSFEYELTNEFFKLINDEDSDVKRGTLKLKLDVNRTSSMFELNFSINGYALVACDRCLDDVQMDVGTQNKLVVKFGEKYSEESDEIVVVPELEGNINIAWFIYEFILLSLPIKHVHPYGQCNKTVVAKLKKHKTYLKEDMDDDLDEDAFDENLDEEIEVEESSATDISTDPRWDVLKKMN